MVSLPITGDFNVLLVTSPIVMLRNTILYVNNIYTLVECNIIFRTIIDADLVFFNSTGILPDHKVLIENVTCKIFNLLHSNLQCFRVVTVRNLKTK